MVKGVILWLADNAVILALIGALIAVILKFEKKLPKRLNQILFGVDIVFLLGVALLAILQSSLDAKWKRSTEMAVGQLQELQKPRELSQTQQEIIGHAISQAPTGQVQILTVQADSETRQYADQITQLFVAPPRHHVTRTVVGEGINPPLLREGLHLLVRDPANPPPHADAIYSAFTNAGVACNPSFSATVETNTLQIAVGAHPR